MLPQMYLSSIRSRTTAAGDANNKACRSFGNKILNKIKYLWKIRTRSRSPPKRPAQFWNMGIHRLCR